MPAGGGAGSWFIGSGVVGTTFAGSGPSPYVNQYNRYGIYGAGTTGPTGNSGFLIVEEVITPTVPEPALTVDGILEVTGAVNVLNNSVLTCGPIFTSQLSSTGNVSLTGSASLSVAGGATVTALVTANGGIASTTITASGAITSGGLLTASGGISCTGTIVASGTITGTDVIATTSDVRSKHDIVTIDSALEKVMKLRGVYYSRNEDDQRRVGVIAQEVEDILPEVVFTDSSEDKNKSVSYGNIVGLLIEAIKEQQEIIKKLM
jgi:hypothetical protein